jgi:hypothetical protein
LFYEVGPFSFSRVDKLISMSLPEHTLIQIRWCIRRRKIDIVTIVENTQNSKFCVFLVTHFTVGIRHVLLSVKDSNITEALESLD